jgi:hypothetical protein
VTQGFSKKFVIIDIVNNEDPFLDVSILQPIREELEDIRIVVLSPGNICTIGEVAYTLLTAGRSTGMNPKHPGLGRSLSDLVAIFDGESRFSLA